MSIEVLERLVRWARAQGGDIKYSGDHPIALAEAELAAHKASDAEIERLRKSNTWHSFNDVAPILKDAQKGRWHWYENMPCKYIELRIDMRDLGCLVMDRNRNRITPEFLAHQWSKSQEKTNG